MSARAEITAFHVHPMQACTGSCSGKCGGADHPHQGMGH